MLAFFLKSTAMSAQIIPFPSKHATCIWIAPESTGAWLVLARGHAWVHGDYHAAAADARWLGRNLGLPIRSAAA